MAVIKAKAEKFMPWMLQIVQRELVLPQLVTRVSDDTFKGARGDTVTMRIGGGFRTRARKYTFRNRVDPIILDDISEDTNSIAIKLDTHTYSATGITNEQMTLDDVDWTREVILPQAVAVAQDLNADVSDAFNSIKYKYELEFNDGDDPYFFLVEAHRLMDQARLTDRPGRYWLVGANVEASIMRSERVTRYDYVGPAAASAIASATIGQIAGTRIVRSDDIDPDFSMIMHSSTVVLGTVAPVIPRGAAEAARVTQNGFGMTWTADYDPSYQQDRSVISTFSGITVVYDERIGGRGSNAGELKPIEEGETPVSVRGLKVKYNGPTTAAGLVPGGGLLGQTSGAPAGTGTSRTSQRGIEGPVDATGPAAPAPVSTSKDQAPQA